MTYGIEDGLQAAEEHDTSYKAFNNFNNHCEEAKQEQRQFGGGEAKNPLMGGRLYVKRQFCRSPLLERQLSDSA